MVVRTVRRVTSGPRKVKCNPGSIAIGRLPGSSMRKPLLVLIAAGVLATPAFAKDHASPNAVHFATELPFHDCDGLICIDVALDGAKPRTLMLDTGNAHSTVITDVAKELGWSLQPLQK